MRTAIKIGNDNFIGQSTNLVKDITIITLFMETHINNKMKKLIYVLTQMIIIRRTTKNIEIGNKVSVIFMLRRIFQPEQL